VKRCRNACGVTSADNPPSSPIFSYVSSNPDYVAVAARIWECQVAQARAVAHHFAKCSKLSGLPCGPTAYPDRVEEFCCSDRQAIS
jgi:hypothetical protein